MNKKPSEGNITIWHQPNNNPAFVDVKVILKALDANCIVYDIVESDLKGHIGIAVPKTQNKKASKLIEQQFGRKI